MKRPCAFCEIDTDTSPEVAKILDDGSPLLLMCTACVVVRYPGAETIAPPAIAADYPPVKEAAQRKRAAVGAWEDYLKTGDQAALVTATAAGAAYVASARTPGGTKGTR